MKLNTSMWVKAVTVMPRITNEEWAELDFVSRWLISTRFAAIIMTIFSVLIAGLIALRAGPVNVAIWAAMLVALVVAHATNNLINDFVDFRRGIDSANYFRDQYGPQPLERGFRTPAQQFRHIALNGIIATAIGIIIVLYRGGFTLPLALAGLFFVIFYTWPLKYIGLGELSLLLVWGPLMIGGGFYVLAGEWSWLVVAASLPYALGVTATLMGKHIDKYQLDREAGVHTLPVVLGERASRALVIVLIAAQYAIIAWLVIVRFFTPVMALVLLALPSFFKVVLPMFRNPRPESRPESYPEDAWPLWFVGSTFVYTRKFGGLFVLALVIDTVLQRWVISW